MAGETGRIGKRAVAAVEAADSGIVVSAVSVWEVAIKRGLGKLDAPPDLLQRLETARVELLPITARHADRVATLPNHHRDPFDRLLVAQAQVEGFTLVSADGNLDAYGTDVLWGTRPAR
jgi:PIN domain nuclease of toxin-antitoxin system